VNHLAEQVDVFVRILFNRAVGNVDRVFHAVTEAEVAGNQKSNGAEIERGRFKVFFAGIGNFVGFLSPSPDHRNFDLYMNAGISNSLRAIMFFRNQILSLFKDTNFKIETREAEE
jgi:hypothetical protein